MKKLFTKILVAALGSSMVPPAVASQCRVNDPIIRDDTANIVISGYVDLFANDDYPFGHQPRLIEFTPDDDNCAGGWTWDDSGLAYYRMVMPHVETCTVSYRIAHTGSEWSGSLVAVVDGRGATKAQQPFAEVSLGTEKAYAEAENFDFGGVGVAYLDTDDPGDDGAGYREELVDLRELPSSGMAVTGLRGGEWMEYTVDVAADADYWVGIQLQGGEGFGLDLSLMGDTGPIQTAPGLVTASAEPLGVYWPQPLAVPAGTQTVRATIAEASGQPVANDIDKLMFRPVCATPRVPYSGPVPVLSENASVSIEAEFYDVGCRGHFDTTTNQNLNAAFRNDEDVDLTFVGNQLVTRANWVGDFVTYSFTVQQGGDLNVDMLFASNEFGSPSVGVSLVDADGSTVTSLGQATVPANGGSVGFSAESISAGTYGLKVEVASAGYRLDSLAISHSSAEPQIAENDTVSVTWRSDGAYTVYFSELADNDTVEDRWYFVAPLVVADGSPIQSWTSYGNGPLGNGWVRVVVDPAVESQTIHFGYRFEDGSEQPPVISNQAQVALSIGASPSGPVIANADTMPLDGEPWSWRPSGSYTFVDDWLLLNDTPESCRQVMPDYAAEGWPVWAVAGVGSLERDDSGIVTQWTYTAPPNYDGSPVSFQYRIECPTTGQQSAWAEVTLSVPRHPLLAFDHSMDVAATAASRIDLQALVEGSMIDQSVIDGTVSVEVDPASAVLPFELAGESYVNVSGVSAPGFRYRLRGISSQHGTVYSEWADVELVAINWPVPVVADDQRTMERSAAFVAIAIDGLMANDGSAAQFVAVLPPPLGSSFQVQQVGNELHVTVSDQDLQRFSFEYQVTNAQGVLAADPAVVDVRVFDASQVAVIVNVLN